METAQKEILDTLLANYKAAVEQWIAAIRLEENFATPDHSMKEWEGWDQAAFAEEDACDRARTARLAYLDALRKELYNF
jgi:hypothetical protein